MGCYHFFWVGNNLYGGATRASFPQNSPRHSSSLGIPIHVSVLMHSTSYRLSGLLSQMLLQPILFPLGLELLGRGLPDILEPVLQVTDLVHAHEARNSTLHGLALARLLHYLLGDFVLGLEDFFLDEFGGHCIKFIKCRQLFLKQSYLLIQLRETLLKHLVLLISLRQLLIQFLLLFLKLINFLNCFLGVLN